MSLMTHAYLLERYGPRLSLEQLAEVLGITYGAIRRLSSRGELVVPTYVEAGKRWVDYRDVAQHLDDCRAQAHRDAGKALNEGCGEGQKSRNG
jgi:hypothetical protein